MTKTKDERGGRTCPACDMELDGSVRFVNGLCPACARERELADAAEEELADALAAMNAKRNEDNENKEHGNE